MKFEEAKMVDAPGWRKKGDVLSVIYVGLKLFWQRVNCQKLRNNVK
jgi:hypothetical protein